MGIWKKIFGKKPDKSPYLPTPEEPLDISFAKNFTSNGGLFLYNQSKEKVLYNFHEICKENKIQCFEKNFTFDDISDCEEAFVTGTFGGVTPVSFLEDIKLNSTDKNSITFDLNLKLEEKIKKYINEKTN